LLFKNYGEANSARILVKGKGTTSKEAVLGWVTVVEPKPQPGADKHLVDHGSNHSAVSSLLFTWRS